MRGAAYCEMRSRRPRRAVPLRAALGIALLGLPTPVHSEVLVVEAEVVVPVVQRLDVVPGTLRAPIPTVQDLERGWVLFERPLDLQISSNVDWSLLARRIPSDEPDGPGLRARASGAAFVPVTETWTRVLLGDGGVRDEVVSLGLRLDLDWLNLPPGTLEPRLEFRLAPRSAS